MLLVSCDNPVTGGKDQTPKVADYDIGTLTKAAGSDTAVTITPKQGKSGGKVTVYYEGTGSTAYPKSSTPPTAAGTYIVTFDVAAASGFTAAYGLSAGTLTISPAGQSGQTPAAEDFTVSGLSHIFDGSPKTVTITPNHGKSTGAITIYYQGSQTAPSAIGSYPVTFDVAAAGGWSAKTGLSAGTMEIAEQTANPQTPAAADFDIGNLSQAAGGVTAVTITPKEGKSKGQITVYYNGTAAIPQTAGTYPVTFDVAAAVGWTAATNLSAGTLEVTARTIVSITVTTPPDKTAYTVGEPLSTAGMVVTATYSDGSTEAVTGYSISGYDAGTIGQKTVTVTYEGKTAAFTVTINALVSKTLVSIAVTADPTKTQYIKGEDLDTAGMAVTATYSDNSTEAVSGYSVSGYDKTTLGNQEITVTYQGKTAAFTVNVIDPALPTVATPTANPSGGMVAANTPVTLACTTDGAEIWYTLDGTTPEKNGTGSAKYTTPITITPPKTVKAIAFKDGSNDSGELEAVYVSTPITVADITITAPVNGGTPTAAVDSEDERFTAETVTWSPADNPFKGSTVYTATVTLTAKPGYTFTGLIAANVKVNGTSATTVSDNPGATLTLSHTFTETDARKVTAIAVKSQPANLTYTHGDTLELTGLAVTLTYDTTETEDVLAENFGAKNITANPAHGIPLVHTAHNGKPVTITYGNLEKTTNNLTVNAKNVSDQNVELTIDPNADQTYTGSEIKPAVIVKHTVPSGTTTTLTLTTDYTAEYANNTNAGTNTATVTITGTGDYTGTKTAHFTINKATPSITVNPTAANITYGAALSTSTLSGGTASYNGTAVAGNFAWDAPATIPIVSNSGYGVTFTPTGTDAANYNTTTGTVNITVAKANSTVSTWPTAAGITYGAALSTSALNGGASTPAGTFRWTDGTIIPTVSNSGYGVTFTPNDAANYNTATKNDVVITVAKAPGAAVAVPTLNGVTNDAITVNAVTASTGQSVEYGFSISNAAAAVITWQEGPTLTGKKGIVNYVFARSKEHANYLTGTPSTGLLVDMPALTTIAELQTLLAELPATTADAPYTVKLNVNSHGGNNNTNGSIGYTLRNDNTKFVNLDLSGSTFTSIGSYAFSACTSLTGIILPNGVDSIQNNAFYDCGLTSIIIPDSVTSIGDTAFGNCGSLTNVSIGNGVTAIGVSFNGCSNLTNVSIGSDVATINSAAFSNCPKLSTVTIHADNTNFTAQDGIIYNKAKTAISIVLKSAITGAITLPDTLAAIPSGAFSRCTDLTGITIGSGVTNMENAAFSYCSNLTSVTFEPTSKVTQIPSNAFYECTSLTSITIPASVTSIGNAAFRDSSLASVTFEAPSQVTTIDVNAFYNCPLTSITIPVSVKSIGNFAFYNTKLTSITIPANVTSIGNQAFALCSSLNSVTFDGTIASANFNTNSPFPGDLRTKFYATDSTNGTAGTYTRSAGGSTWSKQN
jgi:hypothetical protein